jgi:site-specific DNA-methyltransferase (adenine-specific)
VTGTKAGSIPARPVNNNKEIKLNKTNLFGVVNVLTGDCVESMKSLPDESIQTCITSPPYFGLRDYGTATWEGGDINCDHIEKFQKHGGERSNRDQTSQIFQAQKVCKKCGAVRVDKQIGLEETPDSYVQKLVEVFREVRRVLRDDGTLWLNLGDSYNNATSGGNGATGGRDKSTLSSKMPPIGTTPVKKNIDPLLKPKDLIGIPWRVAFALQADGWYLRQDIIWHKPNPMPESVTDRCTKAHEYIFLLSKSQKYYYDNEAIKEPSSKFEKEGPRPKTQPNGLRADDAKKLGGFQMQVTETRNRRSVWTVPTKPFKGAHFATFPPDLIEPCVLAGSPENGVVLDPFGGSGTTGGVAMKLNRKAILCELNPEYVGIMEQRIQEIVNEKKVEQIDPSQMDFFEELI